MTAASTSSVQLELDADGNGQITVDEVVLATGRALNGC